MRKLIGLLGVALFILYPNCVWPWNDTTTGLGPIASGTLSFGDGSSTPLDPNPSAYTHTYTTEGLYPATLTVTDTQGQTAMDTLLITVLSRAQMDALLQAKWSGMRAALAEGNISKTMGFFEETAQPIYHQQFIALAPVLSEIANDRKTIVLEDIIDSTATYAIRILRGGTEYSYLLLFIQDSKGLWKIWRF